MRKRLAITLSAVMAGLALASASVASPVPRLVIPRLGMNAVVVSSLSRGPIFWPGIPGRPGEGRTVAIAGHDVTPIPGFDGHGPFRYLTSVRLGDRITVVWRGRRHVYRVTSIAVVPAWASDLADDLGHERLLLSTCTPPGESAHRLLVRALPVAP